MLKQIVEFFTGKKQPVDVVAPGGAPYKVEAPAPVLVPESAAATTPIPYVPPESVPIPYRFSPSAVETSAPRAARAARLSINTPPVAVLISPEAGPAKKPAVKKPAAIKAPAKPRTKKTPQ